MSELSSATRRLLRLCHIIQKDDANSLHEILADLDRTDRTVAIELDVRGLFHAAISCRAIVCLEYLLAWLSDIDLPDRDGVYPLAASLAGGEQAVYDLLEQHCVIVGEVPKTRADGYPRFHSFVDTVVPRYPVYPRSNPQSPSCCSVGYSVPSEATINAIRRELQRILEQPEHPEYLSEQRRRLSQLFVKYPDIDPDLIQREYQQAFDVEFWTASSATTVPILEAPITAIDACLLRRQYVLVRELVDSGCYSSRLAFPLIAQAVVLREHYILARLLDSGADPNQRIYVNDVGQPLFGLCSIRILERNTVEAALPGAPTMSLMALAVLYNNPFSVRELVKHNADMDQVSDDIQTFNLQPSDAMMHYIVSGEQ